jgi:hypothetical protein
MFDRGKRQAEGKESERSAGWQKECDIMKEDTREFLGMDQMGDI